MCNDNTPYIPATNQTDQIKSSKSEKQNHKVYGGIKGQKQRFSIRGSGSSAVGARRASQPMP